MPDARFRTNLPPPAFPLFDCHVHLGASDAGGPCYPHLTGDEYLGLMEAAGATRACAFAPQREDGYAAANAALADWAATTEGRVLPFARLGGRRLPLTRPHLWLLRRKLRRALAAAPPDRAPADLHRYAGVKLLPHFDGVPNDAVFAQVNALRLPVLVHGGRYVPPSWIERTVLPHLQGPLIIAHLGAFPCEARLLSDAVDLAAQHANVYLDTSGAWISNFIRYAVDRVPEQLLFGSDAPLAHPLVAWQHLASVVQDDGLLRRISHENAQEIFG